MKNITDNQEGRKVALLAFAGIKMEIDSAGEWVGLVQNPAGEWVDLTYTNSQFESVYDECIKHSLEIKDDS